MRTRLNAPLYVENRLVLATGSMVEGRIVAVHGPGWLTRARAGMGGDFSPAPTIAVQFEAIQLADGSTVPIQAAPAPEAPALHMVSANAPRGRAATFEREISQAYHQEEDGFEQFVKQQSQWDTLKAEAVDSLPYRPATIAGGTTYTVRLLAPVTLPAGPAPAMDANLPAVLPPGLVLHARLDQTLDSATSRWGRPVVATLDRPAWDSQQRVLLPEGTRLEGSVVEVRPARWFGRGGVLRFRFDHLELPGGAAAARRDISTHLDGAASAQALRMNGEGQVTATPPGGPAPYVALGVALAAGLHGDADNAWSLNAGSGTHLRIWGTAMAALSTRWQPVALGLGALGTGETIYHRWIGRGHQVVFAKDTALDIHITAAGEHGPTLPR